MSFTILEMPTMMFWTTLYRVNEPSKAGRMYNDACLRRIAELAQNRIGSGFQLYGEQWTTPAMKITDNFEPHVQRSMTVEMSNISHQTLEVHYDGTELKALIKTLRTPMGQSLQYLLSASPEAAYFGTRCAVEGPPLSPSRVEHLIAIDAHDMPEPLSFKVGNHTLTLA